MTSDGPQRTYRTILDALGPSQSMARLGFYSRIAGSGFPSLAPAARDALELVTAMEAARRDEQALLPFVAADPKLASRAKSLQGARSFYLSGSIKDIPFTDLPATKLGLGEAALLVIKYLGQFRAHEAGDVLAIVGHRFIDTDPSWLMCAALVALRKGDWWSCAARLGRAVQMLPASPQGLWDADFWRMLDLIAPGEAHFIAFVMEQFSEIGLGLDPEAAAEIIIGLGAGSVKSKDVSLEAKERIAHALDQAVTDGRVLAVAPAALIETGLKAAEAILLKIVSELDEELETVSEAAALKTDKALDPETAIVTALNRWADASGRLVRTQRSLATLAYARGDTVAAVAAWNAAAVAETATFARMDPKTPAVPPLLAETYRIVTSAELYGLPSARKMEAGPVEPLRPNLMSRVDTAPLRTNHGSVTPYCAVLDQASVIMGDREGSLFWYVKTRDHELLADGLNVHPRFHFGSDLERMIAVSPAGEVLVKSTIAKRIVRVPGTAVLIGGVANYYHWTVEYMPRLQMLRRVMSPEQMQGMKFLINDAPTGWQLLMLQRAGVPIESLVQVPGGGEVICSSLIVPSIPNISDSIAFLRETLGIQPRRATGRKLYVSRLDVHPDRRRIAEEERLAEVLEAAGYDILIPTEVSFEEQIDAFASSDVIVGAHGAAFTNLVYADPRARVIEITNSHNHYYDFFKEITDALGIRHVRYRAASERPATEAENAAAVVDPYRLIEFVDKQIVHANSAQER